MKILFNKWFLFDADSPKDSQYTWDILFDSSLSNKFLYSFNPKRGFKRQKSFPQLQDVQEDKSVKASSPFWKFLSKIMILQSVQ